MTLMCTTVSTAAGRDDLGDDRVADVGAHELGATEVLRGRDEVDPDDPLDGGLGRELARETSAEVSRHPGDEHDASRASGAVRALLLVAPLDAGLLQQLAVLLLRHPLAALLDDGAHGSPSCRSVRSGYPRRGTDDQPPWLRVSRPRRRSPGGSRPRPAPGHGRSGPTRTAGISPECTSRYTVILETRIFDATSATVRKRISASARSPSPAIAPTVPWVCAAPRDAVDEVDRSKDCAYPGPEPQNRRSVMTEA